MTFLPEWSGVPRSFAASSSLPAEIKAHPDRYRTPLAGRSLILIFEKPSLRTRVTFEVGVASLGGTRCFWTTPPRASASANRFATSRKISNAGCTESLRACSPRNRSMISRRTRTFRSSTRFRTSFIPARRSRISSRSKSVSASLRGLKFAYVGDGNNMCHSLLTIGARAGAHVRVATPAGYEPDAAIVAEAKRVARETKGKIELFKLAPPKPWLARRPFTRMSGPAWARKKKPRRAKKPSRSYQVNQALFSHAASDAVFLHCLPAHRGLEVTDEVMDSPRSIVYDQAENRLHVQKAILHTLLT